MNAMRPATKAFFMAARPGQRLCLYHPPAGAVVQGAVVYVHPWAEEMNKSRRMAALQSRALADAGFAVLQIDLHGCGDSSGDFADASWAGWVDDVRLAAGWLQARHDAPLWIWGLRAGCLLAVEAARDIGRVDRLLFWQPIVTGKLVLQQFLRLKAMGDMVRGNAKATMDEIRQQLASGESVEIAGYSLAPSLAAGLDKATLQPTPWITRVEWIEVASRTDATVLPGSMSVIEAWRTAGVRVRTNVVTGPEFWQTTEIEEAPALISTTLAMLQASISE